MPKRPMPWDNQVDLISDDDAEMASSEMESVAGPSAQQLTTEVISLPTVEKLSEDVVIRRAEMYQEYMKNVPIPLYRGSIILSNSWMEFAISLKELYQQPLHYLTNLQLKQWDQARFETGDDHQPLDTVIHPIKAEATIWFIEEVHRLTASYSYLAKLWSRDPMHYTSVDSIFPKI